MLHAVIGFIFVLLSIQHVEANEAKHTGGWRYSALSMATDGSFGGDFRNTSKQAAERLATERCQMGNAKLNCSTISVRYREGSQNVDWLVGMRCKSKVFLVTGPAREQAVRLMWKLAHQAGFKPKADCDLRPENTHAFPADSIFD